MADWHGAMEKERGGHGYVRRSMRDEDFEEDDVWSVVKDREDSSPKIRQSKNHSFGSSSAVSAAWHLPSAPRMIPRATSHEAANKVVQQQSSAPMNIPDWSKIYGKNVTLDSWADNGTSSYTNDGEYHYRNGYQNNDINCNNDEEEDGDDDGMVPPHEWLARKLARSQISSFSVCEGIGRTLKGRDLSKVRNAILTKTGFLE